MCLPLSRKQKKTHFHFQFTKTVGSVGRVAAGNRTPVVASPGAQNWAEARTASGHINHVSLRRETTVARTMRTRREVGCLVSRSRILLTSTSAETGFEKRPRRSGERSYFVGGSQRLPSKRTNYRFPPLARRGARAFLRGREEFSSYFERTGRSSSKQGAVFCDLQ